MLGFSFGLVHAEPFSSSNVVAAEMVTADNKNGGPQYLLAFGKVTIGGKEVETAVQWNTKTGEARMLNAASFSDKNTGQQGNLVGWIPLVDLQQAVQNLSTEITKKQDK